MYCPSCNANLPKADFEEYGTVICDWCFKQRAKQYERQWRVERAVEALIEERFGPSAPSSRERGYYLPNGGFRTSGSDPEK